MANPGESNWHILNVGYGVLNPVGDTLSGKVYNTNDTGFFSMVRQSTVDHFSPSSGVNNGPLVGIVLRNEGKMDLTGPVDPTSWASKYSQLMEKREGLSLIQLRVRIPEIMGLSIFTLFLSVNLITLTPEQSQSMEVWYGLIFKIEQLFRVLFTWAL